MIRPALYKQITDLIDYAQDRGNDIVSNVTQMNTDLDNSEIDPENIHRQLLENTASLTANILLQRHGNATAEMNDFVKALQDHVFKNYGDVNNFLSDNSIQVRPTFAELSGNLGYPIDAENIENIS
jgi:hypothetical protein